MKAIFRSGASTTGSCAAMSTPRSALDEANAICKLLPHGWHVHQERCVLPSSPYLPGAHARARAAAAAAAAVRCRRPRVWTDRPGQRSVSRSRGIPPRCPAPSGRVARYTSGTCDTDGDCIERGTGLYGRLRFVPAGGPGQGKTAVRRIGQRATATRRPLLRLRRETLPVVPSMEPRHASHRRSPRVTTSRQLGTGLSTKARVAEASERRDQENLSSCRGLP